MIDAETQEIFRQETEALIESLQDALLELNKTPDDAELVTQVFRDLHTLKGTGAMFGYARLAEFIHDFEAAFEAVRSGNATVTPELVEVSLKAYDLIVALLDGEDPPADRDAELKAALTAVTKGEAAAVTQSDAPAEAAHVEGEVEGWKLIFKLPPDFMEIGGNPIAMLDELIEIGGEGTVVEALTDKLPALADLKPSEMHTGWQVTLPAEASESDIRDVFMFHEDQMELSLEPILADQPAGGEITPATPTETKTSTDQQQASQAAKKPGTAKVQMRVSAERLDDIMDRVGELVIAEARLSDLAAKLENPDLMEVVENIQRLALGLRDTTMAIRLTPMSSITGRFQRLAHDLAGKTGKDFDFVIEGETTELDKTVIEKLSDPLVHILRNAVDHGLENSETRIAAGKAERGTVTLSARYSGADVLISVKDDGKGLDPDFIRQRAVERGLIAENTILTRSETFALLMEPGFSTAEQITDLSGRGVGTDVVKSTVEALRGSVEIESELGAGSTFTLRLPLTLAIIEGLLMQVGDERFTIPLAAVGGILEQPDDLRKGSEPTTVIELREKLVSIMRLREVFGCSGPVNEHPKVVLVETGDTQVGLAVDRIIGSYQTVIKQLSPIHSRLNVFSGATILGDGDVALIIDVAQLVRSQGLGNLDKEQAA
ncbi:Chemotaxis protein CheA [Thalassovita gelatinovora]|uniref:Chemotaxis protein CheA n=1 Tax=Thalassovita gelatinovora TaxID=53501 RepID=A0A0P1FAV5_THAGE|nr:chemotaxis protein CheA [Thalassovita gelatinovora]QIZ80653.1 chemotaxis protein CheA [Thalassovita gelatinovora]CUH65215.1 Chemotaxis protein CheA [Thalassovita gelatinovora]SEQ87576.1 two-component system, chemotaxis family, sensor kinase CheA [Thalassovita gelatinovora]